MTGEETLIEEIDRLHPEEMAQARAELGPPPATRRGPRQAGRTPSPLDRLLAVVDRLLDPEVVSPFIRAWEFDHKVDADDLHDELRAAREALR